MKTICFQDINFRHKKRSFTKNEKKKKKLRWQTKPTKVRFALNHPYMNMKVNI